MAPFKIPLICNKPSDHILLSLISTEDFLHTIMKAFLYRPLNQILTTWFFSIFFLSASATQVLDSLENALNTPGLTPELQIKLCDDLSWEYLSYDASKSKFYASKGIEIAKQQNDLLMTGTLYRTLGIAFYMNSELDTANYFFDIAMDFARKLGDENLEALVDFARANLHNLNGEYDKALELYLKTLPYFEKSGNRQKYRTVIGNIGVLYTSLQNMEMAERYYLASEKLSLEINDQYGLTQAYNGLGIVYSSRKEYEKAMDYAKRSEKIAHEIGDIQTEALAAQTISEVYYAHYNDFTSAEAYAQKALILAKELGYPANIAALLTSLSNMFYHQGKYEECRKYTLEAIATDTTDMNTFSNMAANMVRIGIMTGDSVNAMHYFAVYRRIIDFRAEKEYQSTLMEMEVKYETEQRELKLDGLEKQRKYGIAITTFGAVSSILIIMLLAFRQRIMNHKKTIAEQSVVRLEQEKQLMASQALLEGENAERKRLARDLHDGLGGMLSVVKLNLNNMKGNIIMPEADVPAFQRAIDMLDNSISELRRVAHNLMPETLLRYGLKAALSDFCHGVDVVKLHFYGDDHRIDEKIEVTLYRIFLELVNNALKHAEAEQINVQVILDDNRINLVVQDSGKGFDPALSDPAKTTGLSSIRTRVESLNGQLEIYSAPGKGTEVQVEFRF
jgi:two-component system, NarL family, sensor kinase